MSFIFWTCNLTSKEVVTFTESSNHLFDERLESVQKEIIQLSPHGFTGADDKISFALVGINLESSVLKN